MKDMIHKSARQIFDLEVMPLFEAMRKPWLQEAREIARRLWERDHRPLSVDDIRAILPPPSSLDPRVMGAVFRKPEWEAIEFVNSGRKACHGRPLRRFVRVES